MTPSSASAYTPQQKRFIVVLATVVPVLVALAGTLWALTWLHELPDPVAIHWNASGPDGFGDASLGLWLLVALVVGFAAFTTIVVVRADSSTVSGTTARFLVVTSLWFSILLTGLIVGSLAVQRGIADAATAPDISGLMLAVFGGATVVAVAAWFVTPQARETEPESIAEAEALLLEPEERVHWSGVARPGRAVLLVGIGSLILSAATVATLLVIGPPGGVMLSLLVLLVLLIAAGTLSFRVRIDRRGVHIRGIAGFPWFSVPLETITAAKALPVDALAEFGGWGVRLGRGGRVGIVLNSSGALEISRATKPALVVTVEDSVTAASVLAGLLGQRQAATG